MAATTLPGEERVGLVLAVVLHGALIAVLLLAPQRRLTPPTPDRIAVTISDDAGLTSTSPEPAARAAAELAPQLGEAQPQPAPEPAEVALPEPAPEPEAPPPTRTAVQAKPKPVPAPPRPVAKPPPTKPSPRSSPAVAERSARSSSERRTKAPAGGARVGADFLTGAGDDAEGSSRNPPAAALGPAVRSSLASAISRQLKPNWIAPQGADAEQLVTVLAWDMDVDGNLLGRPRVVRQEGITDANRAQAARHAEQAIRAVEIAEPFDLPSQYFAAWRHVSSFRFDKRLAQ